MSTENAEMRPLTYKGKPIDSWYDVPFGEVPDGWEIIASGSGRFEPSKPGDTKTFVVGGLFPGHPANIGVVVPYKRTWFDRILEFFGVK